MLRNGSQARRKGRMRIMQQHIQGMRVEVGQVFLGKDAQRTLYGSLIHQVSREGICSILSLAA